MTRTGLYIIYWLISLKSKILFRGLFALILDGIGSGVAEDFDIDRHNQKKTPQMAENPRQFLLDEFKRLRAETVVMVNEMRASDLEIEGRHPFLGVTAIKEMLKLMYIHLNMHMRDIRRVLQEN